MQVNTQTAKQQPPARADASAAAPAGAPADDAPAETDEWRELLRAVLTHGGIRSDVSSICRLLCTSKAVAAVVSECCSRALYVCLKKPKVDFSYKDDEEEQLAAHCNAHAAWLRRNGSLVYAISVWLDYKVQSCCVWPGRSALMNLLPVMTSNTPQLLYLWGKVSVGALSSAAAASEVRSAGSSLAALTSLTHLALHIECCEGRDCRAEESRGSEAFVVSPAPILSSLQCLTNLRTCDLLVAGRGPGFMLMSNASLNHLPAHLTSLQLSVRLGLQSDDMETGIEEAGIEELRAGYDSDTGIDDLGVGFPVTYPSAPQPPMDLGHLTALKELTPSTLWDNQSELAIRARDVLPPNLTKLELDADCRTLGGLLCPGGPLAAPTIEPLTCLTSLQVLTIRRHNFGSPGSRASAQQLKDLAAALKPPRGALRAVSLSYMRLERAVAASAGWSSLPLVSLSISTRETYSASGVRGMVSVMSTLTGLTQLWVGDGSLDVTAKQVTAVLAPLTNLQVLTLRGSLKSDQPDPKVPVYKHTHSAAAIQALSKQVAALPRLVHLAFYGSYPVSAAVINNGPYRHQLTHLDLKGCQE